MNNDNNWRTPINCISIGFAFTVITFNFFWLQYILPVIGVALLYLGFRSLHKENKWLNAGWIFSIINVLLHIANLIYICTPLNTKFDNMYIILSVLTTFELCFIFIFRHGLKLLAEKGNMKLKRDPLLALGIWKILMIISVLIGIGSLLWVFVPLMIFYFYTIYSLGKLAEEFEELPFEPMEETEKTISKKIIIGYGLVCVLIISICCATFYHIELEETELKTSTTQEMREVLIEKGFPKDIIKDISDDEIMLLKNPIYVDFSSEILNFGYNLEATSIYIELEDSSMYSVQYFNWKDGKAYWRDNFSISCSEVLKLVSGRLLYEEKGIEKIALIPKLKNELFTSNDWFGNLLESWTITGSVNYPFGSTKQRGYVFYKLDLKEDVCFGGNIFNYEHYILPFRVPYSETEATNNLFNENLRQHYTNFKTKVYRETNE